MISMRHYKLYTIRREKGILQRDVAKFLGIHQQTYHQKENGKRDFTLKEVRLLAKYFDCTLDDLFGDGEVRSNEEQITNASSLDRELIKLIYNLIGKHIDRL